MDKEKIHNPEEVFCDGVALGHIGRDGRGRWVGLTLEYWIVARGHSRPSIYRELRARAWEEGKLIRKRKGVYCANKEN